MDGGPGRVFPKILPDAVTILLLTLKRPLAFREFAELTRDQRTVHGVCHAVCTCVSGLCYDRGRKEKKDGRDNHPPSSPLRLSDTYCNILHFLIPSESARGHVDKMLFSYDSRVLLCLSSYRISCVAAQESSALVALVVFWFCAPTQPVYFKTGVNLNN